MTITSYDPLKAPDPEAWLALDEMKRIELVLAWHAREGIEPPREHAHAAMHGIVENQIAFGDETPVRLKCRQLMAQGVDRHDAIHAIASVLIKFLAEIVKDDSDKPASAPMHRYYAALRRLNAQKWLRSG